jgi:hydroxymethylbilane synthase
MLVVAMENDTETRDTLKSLNHRESEICVHMEREFLKILEGGCTAPIGALATIEGNEISFKAALFSLDGKKQVSIERRIAIEDAPNFGKECALKVLNNGGRVLMEGIKEALN